MKKFVSLLVLLLSAALVLGGCPGEKKEPKEKSHSLINKIPQNTCVECHDPHKTHEDYEEEGEAGKTDTETDSGEKK